jgi:predicted kinase
MKYFIVICGDLAAGKSTYGKKVSKELQIPFFSKDKIKEILFDSMNNRNLSYEEKRKIGASSYAVFYNIAEQLMEANQAFILESNFIKESEDILKTFISKYDYKCITIKFIGDLKVLHERFKQREYSEERHQSLVANGKFDSFEEYEKQSIILRDFKMNDEIIIDTTDFSKVNFESIMKQIKERITGE